MTQRKAVVPITDTNPEDGSKSVIVRTGYGGFNSYLNHDEGKLTKEDIDAMTIAFESARSDIWKSPIECMVAAAKAAGIEVED